MRYDLVMESPIGRLGARLQDGAVTALEYTAAGAGLKRGETPAARRLEHELAAWFRDPRAGFSFDVTLSGTAFQLKVWEALQSIACGETRTYGELARELGSGARAVGNACRRNPVPIIVPCHRVVSAAGIGGYAGATGGAVLDRKRWLIVHEAASRGLKIPA